MSHYTAAFNYLVALSPGVIPTKSCFSERHMPISTSKCNIYSSAEGDVTGWGGGRGGGGAGGGGGRGESVGVGMMQSES